MHQIIGNITLVGTSHIAKESLEEVRQLVEENSFAAIGVELDKGRLNKLFAQRQEKQGFFSLVRIIGLRAALFNVIAGYAQRRMGKIVNLDPGSEMKYAVQLAKQENIPFVCIDQPIQITMQKLNRALNGSFVWTVIRDFFTGLFFPKRIIKKYGIKKFDLQKVPDPKTIDQLLVLVKKQYPGMYEVLVEQRNEYMVKQIRQMQKLFPEQPLLIVVGAGHLKGMSELLKKENETVLPDLNQQYLNAKLSYTDTKVS